MGKYSLWFYLSHSNSSLCHNLTTFLSPPLNFKSLLGLGLNFCPSPRFSTHNLKLTLKRFKNSIYWKIIIIKDDNKADFDFRYHVRSSENPDPNQVNIDLRQRFAEFSFELIKLFTKKRARTNLLPHQRCLLAFFQSSPDFTVGPTDTNLGPFIIKRILYVAYAFRDHLLNAEVYKELTKTEAKNRAFNTQQSIKTLLNKHDNAFTPDEEKFILSFLTKKKNKNIILFAHFYLLFKVHKFPLKTLLLPP